MQWHLIVHKLYSKKKQQQNQTLTGALSCPSYRRKFGQNILKLKEF